MKQIPIFVTAFVLACPQLAFGCLWDSDSLAVERSRFPGTHELIVGYFPRHSATFYQWRISHRTKIPFDQRTPADYNDIAVAYDKLGDQRKAIETIREKLKRWPNKNIYESHANLGTFLIHSGNYKQGLVHLRKAIEINPDAHFGREEFQILLVEYLISKRDSTDSTEDNTSNHPKNFTEYILKQKQETQRRDQLIADAIKGIGGMIRFGNHDSPVLLESMGDLQADASNETLAARAYLLARRYQKDKKQQNILLAKAKSVLMMKQHKTVESISASIDYELNQSQVLQQQIQDDEERWIRQGKNADEEFQRKYLSSSSSFILDYPGMETSWKIMGIPVWRWVTLLFLMILVVAYAMMKISQYVFGKHGEYI